MRSHIVLLYLGGNVSVIKYECKVCKSKKEDNYVAIDPDFVGVFIQGVRSIVNCNNVRILNSEVTCRTCNAVLYKDEE